MAEEEEIVSKDFYYKEKPDDEFYNYTIHGLNIEGIKRYCTIPINSKYHHMVRLNKDLKEVIENSKKLEKERQQKYDRNNRYDDERLIKMYSVKKEDIKNNNMHNKYINTLGNNYFNNNTYNTISNSTKIIKRKKTIEKPYEIQLDNDEINGFNNNNGKKELTKKILNKNVLVKNMNDRHRFNNDISKYTNLYNKKKTYHSYQKYNKNKTNSKETNFPVIKPRKIIIEYHLTNGAGVANIKKNIGHNHYMGSSFNPYNYFINPKNRTTRNVYGSLFSH